MTFKEAFNLLVRRSCRCKDESKSECDKCSVAYDMIEHIVLQADKYKWHDLRKNPNDLPEDYHTVLICIYGFEGKQIGVSLAMHNKMSKKWGTANFEYKDSEVSAWREIEPYKETE